ncbi:MAG: hypothetical protein ACYDAY_02055 [Candidatus Dormibacteria bacterium]
MILRFAMNDFLAQGMTMVFYRIALESRHHWIRNLVWATVALIVVGSCGPHF